jgi:hypothetical protein
MTLEVVTIVEIDVPFCTLTYGTAPCEAVLGVTGTKKCFNSRRTCQDVVNFDPEPLTVRFMRPSAQVEAFDGLPCLNSVRVTPQELNPGEDLGKRESVYVTLEDMQHTDAGFDKYLDERSYNPFVQGSFWGRFRARFPSLKGSPLRIKRGIVGQDPATMLTWNYVIESTAGPAQGTYSITAKDVLKLADGDRAQAPRASSGILAAPLAPGALSCSLSPVGIGDLEYPVEGEVAIGGSEVCEFTRVGDVLTLVRASSNTPDVEHKEEERVQLVLIYEAESVADILYDLFTSYSDIDAAWIPLSDWQTEVDTNLGRLYSAEIAEPTDVRKLANELILQAGLIVWSDPLIQQIKLAVLRPITPTAAVIDDDAIREETFGAAEQPDKRVSQAWTFYGLRNPLLRLEDRSSYGGLAIQPDLEAEEEYDGPAIKQVFSRWIIQTNRSAAERLNELLLARYRDPPRKIGFELFRTNESVPDLGRGAQVRYYELQDDTGLPVTVPVQVTSLEPNDEGWQITAEEMLFASEVGDKTVVIDVDRYNVNLRTLFDEIYSTPNNYDIITFIVESGINVGSIPGMPTPVSQATYNFGFESGDTGWGFVGFGSHRIDTADDVYSGAYSLKMGWEDNPNGAALFAVSAARIPILPGQILTMTVQVLSHIGGDYARIMPQIAWYDAGGALLSYVEMEMDGTIVGGEERINVSGLSSAAANDVWTELSVIGAAPVGAATWGPRIVARWGDSNWSVDNFNATIAIPGVIDPAMIVGDWPEGPTLILLNSGDICGAGGQGGDGRVPPSGGSIVAEDGQDGGTGLYTRYPITVTNSGSIRGGGGGGGGSSSGGATTYGRPGGGGAGVLGGETGEPNSGAFPAAPGTKDAGGVGNTSNVTYAAGAGGNPGVAGADGEPQPPDPPGPMSGDDFGGVGGAAGVAVDGDSYIAYDVVGTIMGAQVN